MNKLDHLNEVNEILNIKNDDKRKLVFVYTQPKVGSTSIVSSLRLYAIDKIQVIHIHDETMLKMLGNIENVSIQEIINYNKEVLNKDVYVIDVYRSPIERKISAFFEKIGSFHFNNTDKNMNTYNLDRIITRFNNIFTHIANGDHFLDIFNTIDNVKPECFDYTNKYLFITAINGVKYIKLRLKDACMYWSNILSDIFKTTIKIVPDYESKNKEFSELYTRFKEKYCIPSNFLEDIKTNDKYFSYYYSPEEQEEYIQIWSNKNTNIINTTTNINTNKIDYIWVGYTKEQYNLYLQISSENAILDIVKGDHYLDEGCLCNKCNNKRKQIIKHFEKNKEITDRVKHEYNNNQTKNYNDTNIFRKVPFYTKRITKKVMKLM
jgi:hypothetical protein